MKAMLYMYSLMIMVLCASYLYCADNGYQDTTFGGYDLAVMFNRIENTSICQIRLYNFNDKSIKKININVQPLAFGETHAMILNTDPDVVLCVAQNIFYNEKHEQDNKTYLYIYNIETDKITDSISTLLGHVVPVTNGGKIYVSGYESGKENYKTIYLDDEFKIKSIKDHPKEYMEVISHSLNNNMQYYSINKVTREYKIKNVIDDSTVFTISEDSIDNMWKGLNGRRPIQYRFGKLCLFIKNPNTCYTYDKDGEHADTSAVIFRKWRMGIYKFPELTLEDEADRAN
jgi:hypothetical protein